MTSRDERGWRELQDAFVAHGDDGPAEEERPSAEQIWEAVHGRLGNREAVEVIDRAAEDPVVAAGLKLALEMKRRRRAEARRRWTRVAAAALVTIALAPIILYLSGPYWDEQPGSSSTRSPRVEALECETTDGRVLDRRHFLLQWNGPEDTRYELKVSDERYDEVFSAGDLVETEYLVPADRLGRLQDGSGVVWQIDARFPNGDPDSCVGWVVLGQGDEPD